MYQRKFHFPFAKSLLLTIQGIYHVSRRVKNSLVSKQNFHVPTFHEVSRKIFSHHFSRSKIKQKLPLLILFSSSKQRCGVYANLAPQIRPPVIRQVVRWYRPQTLPVSKESQKGWVIVMFTLKLVMAFSIVFYSSVICCLGFMLYYLCPYVFDVLSGLTYTEIFNQKVLVEKFLKLCEFVTMCILHTI